MVKSDPYPGVTISKLECIGHVQKRVGTRLRNLKNEYKEKKLEDGKGLTGKNRLTEKIINTLQNYYGMAIRSSTSKTVHQMKVAVGAVLFHCSEAQNMEDRHRFCPPGEMSWCKWQQDKVRGTDTYIAKITIPSVISKIIRPIFQDLTKDELLKKCLHCATQNSNEALNSIIWKKCPKAVRVNRETLTIGTATAVLFFNNGSEGITKVMDRLNLHTGSFCRIGAVSANKKRIRNMEAKSSESVKKRRKHLRMVQKGYRDQEQLYEPESYSSRAF